MLHTCERCKKQTHKMDKCKYCSRQVCESCKKSGKRASKTKRVYICKDCWSNLPTRTKFKNEGLAFRRPPESGFSRY